MELCKHTDDTIGRKGKKRLSGGMKEKKAFLFSIFLRKG
jgi:hypothetical protein